MSKSLKKNYILNLTNTISTMLFPLITFPYAARIIMADGIGQVNFFSSIISYISLFTCLGIPMYAIRETARVRDNQVELSKTTTEILLLHACLTLFGYLAVFIIASTVPKVMVDISLFLLLSTSIFFTAIGCEWFYQGIEDFKYITIRAITIKSICVVLLFLLVHSKDDLMYYAIYTVVGSVGNNIFNFLRLRKYVKRKYIDFKELKPLRHLKPALHIFVLNLVVSIYINLDTVMLGFLKDSTAVGYYTGATKLTKMLLGIVSSLGTVMVPRLSNLIQNGQMEEFRKLSQKAVDFVFALSFPLFLGLIVSAPILIRLFCGPSYEPAISTLQIISPILLFIALSGVLGIQILYPQGKENIVIKCTIFGAITNCTLNLILIPLMANDGAAIATCVAEFMVTFVMIIIGRKYLPIEYSFKRYSNYIIGGALMFGAIMLVNNIITMPIIIQLFLMVVVGMSIYGGYLYIKRDEMFMNLFINQLKKKIGK